MAHPEIDARMLEIDASASVRCHLILRRTTARCRRRLYRRLVSLSARAYCGGRDRTLAADVPPAPRMPAGLFGREV